MKAFWTGLVACALCLLPATGVAGSHVQTRKAQASMVVSGHITIGPKGAVKSYTLDHEDQLPPVVVKEVTRVVPRWKFRPVRRGGKAVAAKSRMHVRLVARPLGHGHYQVGIDEAYFGNGQSDFQVSQKSRKPVPDYPRDLIRARVTGRVYLLVEVGRDGKTLHVAARQVNLRVKGRPRQMKRWRHELAQACIRAAKQWTYHVPVKGPQSHRDHWYVSMPVTFDVHRWGQAGGKPAYGQWRAYVPGPKRFIPWANQRMLAQGGVGAVSANGLYPLRQSLHLLTPLGGGG